MKSDQMIANNGNGDKKTDLNVYVFNVIEDEWAFIDSISDPDRKAKMIDKSENACDCYFLAMGASENNFVYITPKQISGDFFDYTKRLFNFKEATVLNPEMRSHLICDDLIADPKTFKQLTEKAKEYKRIVLTSYAATSQLYRLRDKLVELGFEVYLPEAPEIDCAWTVNFFGSKSGIRQLAQKSAAVEPDFVMPEGVICVGRFDAAKIAANKYLRQKGVVIKTNKGSGGSGVLIYRENDLPNHYTECEKVLHESLNHDKYWENYPIVVEDLVNINYAVNGGFPNIEFKILKNGRIEMLYYCTMAVTKKGVYYGLDINKETLNSRIVARIIDTGYYVAEQYASAGYRGHFDIDMIAAKNGQIYVCESNTRNTGGTDIYKIALRLLGKEFMTEGYVTSRSKFKLPHDKEMTFGQVLEALEPLLYSPKSKEGVILNTANIEDQSLIYMAIGKNKKRAYDFENKMKHELEKFTARVSAKE